VDLLALTLWPHWTISTPFCLERSSYQMDNLIDGDLKPKLGSKGGKTTLERMPRLKVDEIWKEANFVLLLQDIFSVNIVK